jgi:guanosine-3',5'-bis(diphosphate) 3'-pyrophosphohydrolase
MSHASESTDADAEVVACARAFAIHAHGDQEYGGRPYVSHLDAVAKLLEPYGEQARVIGYLHDVVEDTPVPLERVRDDFGDAVAQCVALVTDEPGTNRAERKARTNAKLAKVAGPTTLALIVKAADRLANLRMSAASAATGDDSKLAMYRREHPAFRAAAFRPGLCDELWTEIDAIVRE